MRQKIVGGLAVLACVMAMYVPSAMAIQSDLLVKGTGQTTESLVWLKIVMACLALAVLPLMLTGLMRELRAERRARHDLDYVSRFNDRFNWMSIKSRVSECVQEMHRSEKDSDMPVVSDCMTDWYWRNQQTAFIDKWQKQGLLNVRHIKSLTRVKPVLFLHRNNGALQEGSVIVISVNALMQDYFIERESGELAEGQKQYRLVEKLWSFMYTEGQWKISNIDDRAQRNHYTKLGSYLPNIEETLMYYSGTKIPEQVSTAHS